MKANYIFKSFPFFSTIIIVFLITIFNQKQNTKLNILVWTTPTLSLGTYVALSTASGFITSYLITSKIANQNRLKLKKILSSDTESIDQSYRNDNDKSILNYDNIFIERDLKDPTPTLNANFRIISKNKEDYINLSNKISKDHKSDYSTKIEQSDNENNYYNDIEVKSTPKNIDWDDSSHEDW